MQIAHKLKVFLPCRSGRLITLLAGLLTAPGTYALDKTSPEPPVLSEKYVTSIELLSRELNVAKEHRNAIIGRMDDIGRQIDILDMRAQQVIDTQPTLRGGIENIDERLNSMQDRIADIGKTQQFISTQLNNLPTPTLWEDALGQSPQKRRERAVKEFQLFKTKNLLQALRHEQQELKESRHSLFDSFQGVREAITDFNTRRSELKQKRRELEAQFVDLSAVVVQKQDRRSVLQERLDGIRRDPNLMRFENARGNLSDPTPGTLRHAYAEPKAQGLLKWEGIVIEAPNGQEISVVFDGQVVFADHMQGLGNVAIIDHGEGYMSLYGMADFLIVEPGQLVLAGDTIGTVGTSVGKADSGLYFEIRRDGDTLDPAKWLESQSFSQEPES